MMTALDVLADAGGWSIESIWLPMLVWTAIALPVFILSYTVRTASPQLRYGVASALIAALPAGLLTAPIFSIGSGISSTIGLITLPAISTAHTEGTFAGAGPEWTVAHTAGLLLVVAAAAAAWRLGRLLLAGLHLRALRISIAASSDSVLQGETDAIKERLGMTSRIRAAVSPRAAAPMTFGWNRPVIVVPSELLKRPDDLRMALLHELIHIRRRDYAIQWAEEIVGAVFVVHPLLAILRRETYFLREATCDAEVVRQTGLRGAYARLLYSFSAGPRAPWHLAMGIFLQKHHLKKRIAAMKDAVDFSHLTYAKRLGLIVAAVIFGISTSLVACTEQFVETETNTAQIEAAEKNLNPDAFTLVDQMPELLGGLQAVQENLAYPELARKAGIEGRVVVSFVVDENGDVLNAEIAKGLGAGLDEAALRAVRLATFEPGRKDGKAVKVKMALPITFKLAAEDVASR